MEAVYFLLGADLRLPEKGPFKDAPPIPRPKIPFDFSDEVLRVYYWWKTSDWVVGTTVKEQSSKVKLVVNIMVLAELAVSKRQCLRHEAIARGLGAL